MNLMPPNLQIDPSVLTPKSDLYPKIWDPNTKKLNSNIKLKLKQIAEDFIRGFKHPLSIKDIILTGSIANYNWNQQSDIDLHVLIDFNDIPDEYMQAFKDYFNAKKEIWNKTHNIMIVGHEVEVYIQDLNEPHHSTGVYSILKNKWIIKPEKKPINVDNINVKLKSNRIMDSIDNLYGEMKEDKNYEEVVVKADKIKDKIKKMRQAGLDEVGEFSVENMVFKVLRRNGMLERLSDIKTVSYDKSVTLENNRYLYKNKI